MATLSLPPSHCLAFAMPAGLVTPPFARDGNCLGFGLGFFIRRVEGFIGPSPREPGHVRALIPGAILGHLSLQACKQFGNDGVQSLQSMSLRLMSQSTTEGTQDVVIPTQIWSAAYERNC